MEERKKYSRNMFECVGLARIRNISKYHLDSDKNGEMRENREITEINY